SGRRYRSARPHRMVVGMARPAKSKETGNRALGVIRALGAAIAAATLAAPAGGQDRMPPITRECQAPGTSTATESPLPNVAAALQHRKRIKIPAIGAASTASMGNVPGGYQALMKKMIKDAAKGVEVEVVNRGVSGELAEQASERLKMQIGLTAPDLVLWQ